MVPIGEPYVISFEIVTTVACHSVGLKCALFGTYICSYSYFRTGIHSPNSNQLSFPKNLFLFKLFSLCIQYFLFCIKYTNVCVVPKKELVCVFPFLGKNSLEIKKRLQNAIERTLPYCKLKVIFKSPSKIVNRFHFKDVLPKNSALASFILSVIAAKLFITAKQNAIFTSEKLNIWEFHI